MSQASATQPANFDESKAIFDFFTAIRPAGKPGVMIDVGAHLGGTFKPYLESGWRVIACEPDVTKHDKLDRFVGRPGFTLVTDAVGDVERSAAPFYTSNESSGIASLSPFRPSHVQTATVQVTTLERVVRDLNVDHVDFLKIDAEGYDLRVLQGFPWLRVRPGVVLCEFDEQKRSTPQSFQTLGRYLQRRGYRVFASEWYPIERYGITHRWRSIRHYPCDLADPQAWGNFIAIDPTLDVAQFALNLVPGRRAA